MEQKYNSRNPAVKRLMREACELKEATEEYCARPLEDNLFEWHFTVHGSPGTDYEGGVYHGRILLPPEYPMKPPNIILLTPNGRFETNKKICLSISGHHPETWQPSWSIRTALLALIAFMSSPGNGAIGSLDYTPEERKMLAKKSQSWNCTNCGRIILLLSKSNSKPITEEETNIISQIALKAEEGSPQKDPVSLEDKRTENTEDTEQEGHSSKSENVSHVDGNDTNVRQRQISNTNEEATAAHTVTIQTEHSNDIRSMLIWGIVAVIILLLARRIFLMY